jgi:hypothetical protein
VNNIEFARHRAEHLHERAAELKLSDDERDQEYAHELEDEACQIEHELMLASLDE